MQRLILLRKAEPDHLLVEPIPIKRRQRDGGDADLAGEPLAELGLGQVTLGHGQLVDGDALEVGAFAGQQAELGFGQAFAEQVALGLVEGGQAQVRRRVLQVGGQAVLHGGVDGEDVELVHLAEFGRQRGGGGDVADLPARHVVGLAEAADDEAARGQAGVARHAFVLQRGVDHVLVHLVADHQHVGGGEQFIQPAHVGG